MMRGSLSGVAALVGTHYEIISIIFRLLGAKVSHASLFIRYLICPIYSCD
jgi:hypothetical protein